MKLRSKLAIMVVLAVSIMSFGASFADDIYPDPKPMVIPPVDDPIVMVIPVYTAQ